jgi:hypothetical protein
LNPVVGATNAGPGTIASWPASFGPPNAPMSNALGQAGDTNRNGNPPPTEFGLPEGWSEMPIGKVLNPHAEYINTPPMHARFELSGIAGGFATNRDDVLFVCKWTSQPDFKATLLRIDSDSPLRRSGIMIRESAQPDADFLFVGTSPQNVLAYGRSGRAEFSETGDAVAPSQSVFLQFTRQKDSRIMAWYSFDSETWKTFEGCSFAASQSMLVGFAICSGNSSNRVKARFLDITARPLGQR